MKEFLKDLKLWIMANHTALYSKMPENADNDT
jgi:hypothetical protein